MIASVGGVWYQAGKYIEGQMDSIKCHTELVMEKGTKCRSTKRFQARCIILGGDEKATCEPRRSPRRKRSVDEMEDENMPSPPMKQRPKYL